jgi:DNA-binding NarL/FixJ family response regulator
MLTLASDEEIDLATEDAQRPPASTTAVVIGAGSPALIVGLQALVEATDGMRLAGTASSPEGFLQVCVKAGPCIALVDPHLGGQGIMEFVDSLARRAPRAMPLLMTNAGQPHALREALKNGVFGFVSLSADIAEIREALESVAAGRRYIPPSLVPRLAESLLLEDLTNREMQVLGLLSRGCCNKTIARDLDVAVGTVKTHVRAIMYKLGSRSRTAVVLEANRRGLITIG